MYHRDETDHVIRDIAETPGVYKLVLTDEKGHVEETKIVTVMHEPKPELPKFAIVMNGKVLRQILGMIHAVADEYKLKLTPDGLTLRAMDPARVQMVNVNAPKDVFDLYVCDADAVIPTVSSMIPKIKDGTFTISYGETKYETHMDDTTNPDVVTVTYKPYYATVKFGQNGVIDERNTPTGEILVPKEMSFPDRRNVTVQIDTHRLMAFIDRAKVISDSMRITIVDKEITFTSKNDDGKTTMSLTTDVQIEWNTEMEHKISSAYPLPQFEGIVKAIKDGTVTLKMYDDDYPMAMAVDVPSGNKEDIHVWYALAPRMEQ